MFRVRLILAVGLLAGGGCSWLPTRQQTRYVDPKLPMSLSCSELVNHLNRQCHGLHAWRCMETTVYVRLPNGIRQRLSGHLACEAPSRFRLTASNVLANADLGANAERCWFYSRPGDGQLLTWRHEDSDLLQQMNLGVPRIEPGWLMEVLGVMPLNAEEFTTATGPAGSQELWLTSVSDGAHGTTMRRVIKVDAVSGMVREHGIYDQDRNPVVRAAVTNHKSVGGHLLPRDVLIEFPRMDTELSLRFGTIETNCRLPENLWRLPEHQNVQVVDLGNHLRAELRQRGVQIPAADPFSAPEETEFRTADREPSARLKGRILHPAQSQPDSPGPSGDQFADAISPGSGNEWEAQRVGSQTANESAWPAVKPLPEDFYAAPETTAEPDWDLPAERGRRPGP